MAPKSTRELIRWNVWRAADRISQSMESLRHATELADGHSEPINKHMETIILTLEQCRLALLAFRDDL